MEFHEKLQELRKQKGLTQEELAKILFVSRAAVSKWESGRGFPNLESLKALSKFYGVTIDALLSGEEALSLAEAEHREKESRLRAVLAGLLDLSAAMLLFMPFFGQEIQGQLRAVSLPALTEASIYLRMAYYAVVAAMILSGLLLLALPKARKHYVVSMGLHVAAVLLFTVSRQPYAAVYAFGCLMVKGVICQKQG